MVFIIFKLHAQTCSKAFHIVILGSSTAAGYGPSDITKSWAYMFADSLKKINPNYIIDNLAVGGTTTYNAQPNSYVPPPGRPKPLKDHNITKAIKLNADAVILNYPSNDAVNNFSAKEQKENYERISAEAAKHNILVWVATPQPRDYLSVSQVASQQKMYHWIKTYYKEKAIDFHKGLASEKDSIFSQYGSGDGTHLNDAGHKILFNRVIKESIPDSLCKASLVPIATASIKRQVISEATY